MALMRWVSQEIIGGETCRFSRIICPKFLHFTPPFLDLRAEKFGHSFLVIDNFIEHHARQPGSNKRSVKQKDENYRFNKRSEKTREDANYR